jgi:hypothetical protein
LAAWLVGIATVGGVEKSGPVPPHLVVDLRDGSRLVGDTDLATLSVATEMAGQMSIPVPKITTVEMGDTNHPSLVTLANGDRLKGTLQIKTLKLTASFGQIAIPLEVIRRFTVTIPGRLAGTLSDGLVLDYSFATDDGGTVKDLSGHGNDGKVFGAAHVANGVSGGAYDFNGQGDYIRVPLSPSLHWSKFTASAWVWARRTDPVDQGMSQGIISQRRSEVLMNNFGLHGQQHTVGVAMGAQPGDGFLGAANDEPIIGRWGMITLTYDGAQAIAYLNGQPVRSGELAGYHSSEDDLLIGANEWPSTGDVPQGFWDGLIGEVRIYNRALSPEEVQALYDSAAVSNPTPKRIHTTTPGHPSHLENERLP